MNPLPPLQAEELMARIRAEVQRRKLERPTQRDAGGPATSATATPGLGNPYQYQWGQRLGFGVGQSGAHCLREGWAAPEADFTWSLANAASIEIPVPVPPHDMILAIDACAFTWAGLPTQRVKLLIDRVPLAEWSLCNQTELSTLLFQRYISGKRALVLQFELPQANSPHSAGLSDDGRLLGIALRSITITPLPVR